VNDYGIIGFALCLFPIADFFYMINYCIKYKVIDIIVDQKYQYSLRHFHNKFALII
jgi:hypothetical protein